MRFNPKFDKLIEWSNVDPNPQMLYLAEYDTHFVVWDNKVMTHKLALALIMEYYHIWITPAMMESITEEYSYLHSAGAFGDNMGWEDIIKKRLITYMRNTTNDARHELLKDKPLLDAVNWLMHD